MSNPETVAMLRNLISKLNESCKTNSEIMGWIVAEALTIFKDMPEPEAKQSKPTPVPLAPNRKGDPNPTGPVVEWKPPVGGFYRFDGRFVPDETWKPVGQSVVQERAPSVPDVLAQITRVGNSGSHLGTAKDGRARDANATGGACAVEWIPPAGNGKGHYEPYGPNGEGSRWIPDSEV